MSSRAKHTAIPALCAALLMALSLALPSASLADVRKTDVICGTTVQAAGFTSALCPDIDCNRAMIVDSEGVVYYERNADERCHIASITKVMTAITALENASLDTTVSVSETAAKIGESTAELKAGDTLTLQEALKALLWPSGNDAAVAIAESVGAQMLESQGADASDASACQQAFVDAMNTTAASIGMNDSLFSNPHGLDTSSYANEEMYSTARDVATMCAYAMGKSEIKAITSMDGGVCTVTRDGSRVSIELESTDELLGSYEGVEGVKTGWTSEAGYCFASACDRNGHELFGCVLDGTSEEGRFTDTTTLWDWTYQHCISYPLVHTTESVGDKPVVAYVGCSAWADRTVAATVEDPSAAVEVFDLSGNVSQEATFTEPSGEVKAGDELGEITYYQHNEQIAKAKLVAAEDVEAPGFFDSIGIWFLRLTGGGQAAESYLVNDTPLILDKSNQLAT